MQKKGRLTSLLVRFKFSAIMAFDGITSNVLRTFLTVLGIAIGVGAVVSLMGIGEGARESIVSQFESLGENVIVIKSNTEDIRFETDEAEGLAKRVTGVEYATPVVDKNKVDVRWRRDDFQLDIIGVNQYYPQIKDHPVSSGNFFTSLHIKQRSPVAVLGFNVAKSLMNGRSPVGQTIKIDGINYRITGVLSEKGEGKGDDIDNKIVIPYTSAMKISTDKDSKNNTNVDDTVDEIWAKSNSADDAELAMVQLGRIYNRKIGVENNITPNQDQDKNSPGGTEPGKEVVEASVSDNAVIGEGDSETDKNDENTEDNVFKKGEEPLTITSLNNLVEEADQANRIMTVLLGGIAAVSLLVGGIGIMNIMLVAVTERTSEIGVRRALGAKQEDLLIQFMLEAIYVSIIGCIVGIALGAWAVSVVSRYGLSAVISFRSIKIAVGVALCSGLLFGVYPAINASSLPPVEALKRQ